VCKLQSVVNLDCDFSLVTNAAYVHYNFQSEKEILSFQFYVSFVGETFIFLEMCANCRVFVNLDCDFSLVPNVADVKCKLQSVVNFDRYVTMPPIAVEVDKLEIFNLNLNKQFI